MSGGAAQQIAHKQGEYIISSQREVYESLAGDKHFKLFMGWLIQRCGLTDAIYENSGSELFKFEGRRQIAVEVLKAIEEYAPGFYERVLLERRNFDQDLKRISLTPEERAKLENDDE